MLKIIVAILVVGCGSEIKIRDSEHKIIFEMCDKETFPDLLERKQCIERIIDILDQ